MPQNVCTRVSLSTSGESSCCLLIACGTAHPTKPSSPSSRTAPEIPLTRTSTCFTCRLSAWAEVSLSQEHALSPDPAYGSRKTPSSVHKLRDDTSQKFNQKSMIHSNLFQTPYWFSFFSSFFSSDNTHSLCWVTHGCHLFKKPSTWIYILTLWSPMSLPDCERNGEGRVFEKLPGINEFQPHAHIHTKSSLWCFSCQL